MSKSEYLEEIREDLKDIRSNVREHGFKGSYAEERILGLYHGIKHIYRIDSSAEPSEVDSVFDEVVGAAIDMLGVDIFKTRVRSTDLDLYLYEHGDAEKIMSMYPESRMEETSWSLGPYVRDGKPRIPLYKVLIGEIFPRDYQVRISVEGDVAFVNDKRHSNDQIPGWDMAKSGLEKFLKS